LPEKVTEMEPLTEQHLSYFGSIAQWFARYERLMQEVIAQLSGADISAIMLLTQHLDFNEKWQALVQLLRHSTVPVDQFDRIRAFLLVPYTFIPLHHDIIHSTWVSSEEPDVIQPHWVLNLPPMVEALHIQTDSLSQKFFIQDREKRKYTLHDFAEIENTLATNYQSLRRYLQEYKLLDIALS
jgi:hypothetical protein